MSDRRKERLIAEAEAKIGTRLIFGPSGPDGNVAIARPLSELLAEAEQESQPKTSDSRPRDLASYWPLGLAAYWPLSQPESCIMATPRCCMIQRASGVSA